MQCSIRIYYTYVGTSITSLRLAQIVSSSPITQCDWRDEEKIKTHFLLCENGHYGLTFYRLSLIQVSLDSPFSWRSNGNNFISKGAVCAEQFFIEVREIENVYYWIILGVSKWGFKQLKYHWKTLFVWSLKKFCRGPSPERSLSIF